MNTTDFELLSVETVSEHAFDLTITRAPRADADLGFYKRVDGETVITLKVGPFHHDVATKPPTSSKKRKNASKQKAQGEPSISEPTAQETIDISLMQSMSLLNSQKESSTTGAMLWKVSVPFVEWFYEFILSPARNSVILGKEFNIVELGCGAAALLPMALGRSSRIAKYLATDQSHIIKLARQNINRHFSDKQAVLNKINTIDYDWEDAELYINDLAEALAYDKSYLGSDTPDLVIIACDTIYNEYLIPHFISAAMRVCQLASPNTHVHLFIAQQVRDPVVLESFLSQFVEHPQLQVWSVPEECLTKEFKEGYVLHYARFLGT